MAMSATLHNFLMLATFVILFATKAMGAIDPLENGVFGPIETINDEESGNRNRANGFERQEYQNVPMIGTRWPTDNNQDWLHLSQMMKLLLGGIQNRKANEQQSLDVPRTPQRQSYGKRQIIYRQCFFNPISCF